MYIRFRTDEDGYEKDEVPDKRNLILGQKPEWGNEVHIRHVRWLAQVNSGQVPIGRFKRKDKNGWKIAWVNCTDCKNEVFLHENNDLECPVCLQQYIVDEIGLIYISHY